MFSPNSLRTSAQRQEGLLEPTSQAYKESVFDTQDELGSLIQENGRSSKRRERRNGMQRSAQRKRNRTRPTSREDGARDSDRDGGSQQAESSQEEEERAARRSKQHHSVSPVSDEMPTLDDHPADSPPRNSHMLRSALAAEDRSEDGFEGEDDPQTRERWARMDAQKDVFLKKRQGKENFPPPRIVPSVLAPNMSEGSRSQVVRKGKTSSGGRQFWTQEETDCLLRELRIVAREKKSNPRLQVYPQILKIHGRDGEESEVLKRYDNGQLKDKARNELIRMKRDGHKLPFWKNTLFPNLWVSH